MRYASRLDYFLFNALFLRQGLRLSRFANGIRFYYYRPLLEALRVAFPRLAGARRLLRTGGRLVRRASARASTCSCAGARRSSCSCAPSGCARGCAAGGSVAHGRAPSSTCSPRSVRSGVGLGRADRDLVPLALFWRKGPRSERRFLNLSYGAPTRPSDFAKVTSFLITYRDLAVKVGDPIDLRRFARERRAEGEDAVVRKVRRSILVFLYREEKVVEGPTLQPRHRVQEIVLRRPGVRAAIAARARERGRPAGVGARRGREDVPRDRGAT